MGWRVTSKTCSQSLSLSPSCLSQRGVKHKLKVERRREQTNSGANGRASQYAESYHLTMRHPARNGSKMSFLFLLSHLDFLLIFDLFIFRLFFPFFLFFGILSYFCFTSLRLLFTSLLSLFTFCTFVSF